MRGASSAVQTKRERLGRIVCGCELRQSPAAGGRRHHHFTAVLRDLAGNIWECEHPHTDQDEAHECARAEYARREPLLGSQAKTSRLA